MFSTEPDFMINKEITACFSGHRPEKFPFSEADKKEFKILQSLLRDQINNAIDLGYTTFITGMAKGIDTWAALEVLQIKNVYPDIKLVGASPYRDEIKRLKGSDLWNYSLIMNSCDQMFYISEHFFPSCFIARNKFMVDNSSMIIGVVCDMNSGTGNTLRYAEKHGLKKAIIDISTIYESEKEPG